MLEVVVELMVLKLLVVDRGAIYLVLLVETCCLHRACLHILDVLQMVSGPTRLNDDRMMLRMLNLRIGRLVGGINLLRLIELMVTIGDVHGRCLLPILVLSKSLNSILMDLGGLHGIDRLRELEGAVLRNQYLGLNSWNVLVRLLDEHLLHLLWCHRELSVLNSILLAIGADKHLVCLRLQLGKLGIGLVMVIQLNRLWLEVWNVYLAAFVVVGVSHWLRRSRSVLLRYHLLSLDPHLGRVGWLLGAHLS